MSKKNFRGLAVLLVIILFLQPFIQTFALHVNAEGKQERTVTLVGNFQDELGGEQDWDPASTVTIMKHDGNQFYSYSATLPAGDYEYKIAINGSWDENYGTFGVLNGENIKLNLTQETTVHFYYHDGTHSVTDSRYYTPILEEKRPRIAGSLQPFIQAGDEWSPDTSTALFYDDNFDGIYTYTTIVPKGNYEYKVVLGNQWGEEYPNQNAQLNVLQDTEITFYFDAKSKKVSTNYSTNESDQKVEKEKLYHNTWEKAYRNPFGAIPVGEEVRLRLAAGKNDLTRASVEIKNYQTGTSKVITLTKKATIQEETLGEVDIWEGDFTPKEKGVYGYKFIVADGESVAEYGEDSEQGGTGKAVDQNAELFQLTVFDPNLKHRIG
ncbi:hypothetical protein [Bacillus kexueae]|uniref:pullulanase X25 domain-containing protein n=1 Tax=Aeribacillus kexueae TaxID=2078952 RepID=UPI001FAF7197|nr:hypothetical protein [Bacillus kexueae]